MNQREKIKCVIWDLDNTVWNGILLENGKVSLNENVHEIIKALDNRGILNSIASKNDFELAETKLKEFGLWDYFLYPQINWNSKVNSIEQIAQNLNISLNSIAFIDDQEFERSEVEFSLNEVRCYNSIKLENFLDLPEMNPRFINSDSKNRRELYKNEIIRKKAEENFVGPAESFLATLEMKLDIFFVGEDDLERAEELTIRTNQLNSTGYTYSYEELRSFKNSKNHMLLMARLQDKFGDYGNIGLLLLELDGYKWTIKLILISCRVMSRGIGAILLNYIARLSKRNGNKLFAEFKSNNVNRMMYITLCLSGFEEIEKEGVRILFEYKQKNIPQLPDYIKFNIKKDELQIHNY